MCANTYTITATDTFSPGTHFIFNVNEQNFRNTTAVPSGWPPRPLLGQPEERGLLT